MIKNTKKAFTLVELIVVITILAILGTIGFISLEGYFGEARDSKRLSDVNNLIKKVNIEMSKGTSLTSLIISSGSTITGTGVKINGTGATVTQGVVNFTAIKENEADFQDRVNGIAVNYPMSVTVGGSGTGAYKFMQIATVSEAKNSAVVVGNYYKMQTDDSDSIIINGSNKFVVDDGADLPYNYQ